MILDFTETIAAGRTAAESTRQLAATLALEIANDTWKPEEHNELAVQGLSLAAGYMLQILSLLEATNDQMRSMFGPEAAPGPQPAASAISGPPAAAASLLALLLKGVEAQRAEKAPPPRRWPPVGGRRKR